AEAAPQSARLKERLQQYHSGVVHGFYDLAKDPDERQNLYASRRQECARLQQLLLRHMERTADPQLENYRRSMGATKTPLLFNLVKDIGQENDMAAAHPEMVRALQVAWDRWNASLVAPRWPATLKGMPLAMP